MNGKEKKNKKVFSIIWCERKFKRKESKMRVEENMIQNFLSPRLSSSQEKIRENIICYFHMEL